MAERRARPTTPGAVPHGDDLLGLLLDSGLHRPRGPRRAGHHGDRRPRDRRGVADLDADAAGRAPDGAGGGPGRAGRALPGPVSLLDHRDRVPRTRAVIDEALRLFPPAWVISRRSDARGRRGRDDRPGRHARHHQPVARAPARRHRGPSPRPSGRERFLDPARGARRTCRSARDRGCASVASSRSARWPSCSTACCATHRAQPARPGWTRPEAQATVAVHPRGGMPLARDRGRRGARHDDVDVVVARPGRRAGRRAPGCSATCARCLAAAIAAAAARHGSRSSCRPATRSSTLPDAPGLARRARGAGARGRRGGRRLPRRHGDGGAGRRRARGRRRRARRPAGPARRGRATRAPAATTGDLLLFLDADTVARARTPSPGCSPLHARHGGLVSVQPHHRVVRPHEQLSAYFNVVAVMASAAFTGRAERRGRWPSGPAC